jgi:hypothetical protein
MWQLASQRYAAATAAPAAATLGKLGEKEVNELVRIVVGTPVGACGVGLVGAVWQMQMPHSLVGHLDYHRLQKHQRSRYHCHCLVYGKFAASDCSHDFANTISCHKRHGHSKLFAKHRRRRKLQCQEAQPRKGSRGLSVQPRALRVKAAMHTDTRLCLR